jgi:hypothetical protein
MEDKLKALIEYVQSDGRICPMPDLWNKLWEMLPERKQKENGRWEPPLPLILAAWWDTTAEQKRERLMQHVKYAAEHGVLNEVDKFLRKLNPGQWAYGNGTTTWQEWQTKNA